MSIRSAKKSIVYPNEQCIRFVLLSSQIALLSRVTVEFFSCLCQSFFLARYLFEFSLSLSRFVLFPDREMPIVKSTSTTSESTSNEAREALDCLHELSQLLNTGLDKKTLTACVRLLEGGVHPDALAQIIQVLRTETRATKL